MIPEKMVEAAGVEELIEEKNEAYRQRNHLVAALARLFPSGIRQTNIDGWDQEWNGCVYIDLPIGQISYHYHVSQSYLFDDLPPYTKEWDGHEKETVHQRLAWLGVSYARMRAALEKASVGELIEALKPFAVRNMYPSRSGDDLVEIECTIHECHNARAVLEKLGVKL